MMYPISVSVSGVIVRKVGALMPVGGAFNR